MSSVGSDAIELSIIIVSYNTRDITLDCLASLYRYPPSVPFEVLLLDNESADGSAAAVREAYPRVRLFEQRPNLGFAGGNNVAAKSATGRRILLLNPDTIVLPETFAGVWDFAERQPWRKIWGGRTLQGDGKTLNPTSCWRRITLWSLFSQSSGLQHLWHDTSMFNPEVEPSWQRDTERDVDIVSGCFLMIDADLWQQLGGFDPHFFMYGEDADLSLRARALGARPGISPKAELIHLGGASSTRTEALMRIVRGRITLMQKHWSPLAYRLGKGMILYWSWCRMVLSRFKSGRGDGPGESRTKWKTIWDRRQEWLRPY